MNPTLDRRAFLGVSGLIPAASLAPSTQGSPGPRSDPPGGPAFNLGMITYNLGATWDLATLLRACRSTGYRFLELRTTHAHKVEPDLGADQRRAVRQQFEDSGVALWSFGTVCEFQAVDPDVVRKNVDDCRAFCSLASDLGAKGVKVRPNGVPKGADLAKTLDQIGHALRECGKAAQDHGVEIWVEVHGAVTQEPTHFRTLMDACGHPAVGICWNSNPTDVKEGSIREAFELLKKDIRSCHINELWSPYPYRQLFSGLKAIGYKRVTFMECAGVPEAPNAKTPEAAMRFMRYYRALWSELCR